MKFLIDAQISKKISEFIKSQGFDSKHTLELENKNFTADRVINNIALNEKRILVTKDYDFVYSLLASDKPYKLLYISTGNISNSKLESLIKVNLTKLVSGFNSNRYIELTNTSIIIHE